MSDLSIVRASATSTTAPVVVNIQAPALFQLLEVAIRSEKRVIGTLLGSKSDDGSEIEVKDCFIVPHSEDSEDQVTLEEHQHRSLLALHRKSSQKDLVLGWFSTVDKIDAFTNAINEFYSRGLDTIVHLTVAQNAASSIPEIRTYVSTKFGGSKHVISSLNLQNVNSSFIYTPVHYNVHTIESEQVLVNSDIDSILAGNDAEVLKLDSESEFKKLVTILNKTEALIDLAVQYIDNVESGAVQADKEFVKFLTINLTSNINTYNLDFFKQNFNSHIEDNSMVEYLTNSLKTQLELTKKLPAN